MNNPNTLPDEPKPQKIRHLKFKPLFPKKPLSLFNPLNIRNFCKTYGRWWDKMFLRQALLLGIALQWRRLVKQNPNTPPGLITSTCYLMQIITQVGDGRQLLEIFFDIKQTGYWISDSKNSPTIITPKKISKELEDAIEEFVTGKTVEIEAYDPGPPPTEGLSTTRIKIQTEYVPEAIKFARQKYRDDLIPELEYLQTLTEEITFYYRPTGENQARDSSVWPIKALECWPREIRHLLLGNDVDIENSYAQFLLEHLNEIHKNSPLEVCELYPELVLANQDKHQFRQEILDLLKLKNTPENMKQVKNLLMALSNGSNASFLQIVYQCPQSAVRIVREFIRNRDDFSYYDMSKLGDRLLNISRQFRKARKAVFEHVYGRKPKRADKKAIFHLYFQWERKARYKIMKCVNFTGLHVHDACQGIQTLMSNEELEKYIRQFTGLRVSVKGCHPVTRPVLIKPPPLTVA